MAATAGGRDQAEGPGAVWVLTANLLAVAPLVCAFALEAASREAYYQAVQEDEFLEWATVWTLVAAAAVFGLAARRQRRVDGKLPWFLGGLVLFCLIVAGEEISWGQRLLGYRPPTYFLAENFQQELNVHNLIDTSLRKLGLKSVVLGYGVVLGLAAAARPLRRLLDRLAVVAPPWQLAPAFLVTYLAYEVYPLDFTGEVVELMLALALLFVALWTAGSLAGPPGPRRHLARLAIVVVAVCALALASTATSRRQRGAGPQMQAAVEAEIAALRGDFLALARAGGGWATRCGLHKRLYSFVEKYRTDHLYRGEFGALTDQGMPEERAAFFLDPWNTPYWIRDECSRRRGRRIIFVYSFGPNRKRESTEWELQGDDVGAIIFDGER